MDNSDNTVCQYCNKSFKHLGSHIWHKHKITAKEYKTEFELDYKFPLISQEVKRKKQVAYEERREYYLKNFLIASKKYQFKKGHTGQHRISQQSRDRQIEQLDKMDNRGLCEICKMMYDHIYSHYYTKHGLLKIKNKGGEIK